MNFSFFCRISDRRSCIDALFHYLLNFRELVVYRCTFSFSVKFQIGGRVQILFFIICRNLDRRSQIDELFHFLSNFRQAVAYRCTFSLSIKFQIRVLVYRCTFSFSFDFQIGGRVQMHFSVDLVEVRFRVRVRVWVSFIFIFNRISENRSRIGAHFHLFANFT